MRDGGPRSVLVLHRGGDQVRGSEEALLTLLSGLDRAVFRPVVLHSHPVLSAPLEARGIECKVHDFPEIVLSLGERRFPIVRWLRALRGMTALARTHGAELVIANGGGPCQLGVPLARRLGIPLACLLYHPAPRYLHRAWMTRRADVIAFISRFTAEHTRGQIGRAGPVVPLGIDVRGRFIPSARRDPSLRASLGIAPGDVVFAQVGALVPHKEHALLLGAFARVRGEMPNARLLVIGAGPEDARLRGIAAELGIADGVTFTGRVDDVVPHLQHAVDVSVLASGEEGLGLVNVEASACGLPVVAADATGARETVMPERTGLLFPPGDAAALAACMLRLGGDADLRAAMGRDGRAFAVERFSAEGYCARMQAILESALRGPAEATASVEMAMEGARG